MSLVLVRPRKGTGALYRAEGLYVSACYPNRMYGRRGRDPLGAPAWDGTPVRLGPNQHPENSNAHVRAAYDIAAFARGDQVRPIPGTGTKTFDVAPTIAVDPGYYTGITLRVGTEALNWATIAPPEPYRTVDDFELIDAHIERVLAIVRWFTEQYRQHAPFVRALELVSTRDKRAANRIAKPLQITARLVQALMRELPRLETEAVAA